MHGQSLLPAPLPRRVTDGDTVESSSVSGSRLRRLFRGGLARLRPGRPGLSGQRLRLCHRPAGPGAWFVEYTEVDAALAGQGANRRAKELCRQNGFGGVDFRPLVVARGDLVVAQGRAACRATPAASVALTPAARLAEIDAEIAALRQRRITQRAPGSTSGTTNLDMIASGLNRHSELTIDRQIQALERERAALGG